ncbi:hypothetical protein LMIY3S_03318 [Labrys miyagiensis]
MPRLIYIATIAAALAVASPYPVIANGAPDPDLQKVQDFETQGMPDIPPKVTDVTIVDLEELPPPVQQQVEDQVQHTSQQELRVLRRSIEEMPQLSSELRRRGVSSNQVIAVSLDSDGAVTLVINTEA